MNRLKAFILRQYNVGMWLGALKDTFSKATSYMGIINFALIVPTAYHTTLREPLMQYASWMTFWVFASICVLLVLLAMAVEFKIVLPSSIYYANWMRYKHRDPIRRDIAKLKEQMDRLEEILGDGKR